MLKVFIAADNPAGKALEKTLALLGDTVSFVGDASSADLIVVMEERELHKFYSEDKHFAIISVQQPKSSLPKNARWFPVFQAVAGMFGYVAEIADIPRQEEIPLQTGTEYSPKEQSSQSIRVLVIDDKKENLKLALDLLGKKHFVTLASGYREAKVLIAENNYSAVLSDCQMPADTQSALSTDAVKLGETIHNGFFLAFPATKKGARFAVVTDANHHQDWVSAIFDDLRDPQTINGQPVLFINYMGKRWDEALDKLINL